MDASCENTYNETSNTINSPNYPREYPHNKYCTWNVTAPVESKISVERFSYSIVESSDCIFQYLEIYDGLDTRSGMVANLCGENTYGGMNSTTNNLFFVFHSDWYQAQGFQIRLFLIGMKMYIRVEIISNFRIQSKHFDKKRK